MRLVLFVIEQLDVAHHHLGHTTYRPPVFFGQFLWWTMAIWWALNPLWTLISVFGVSIVNKVVFPGLFGGFWSDVEV